MMYNQIVLLNSKHYCSRYGFYCQLF